MHASFGFRLDDQTNHRLDAVDGGSLMDVGCYCVNGARLSRAPSRSGSSRATCPGPSTPTCA